MGLFECIGYRRRWQVLGYFRKAKISDFAPIVVGGCGASGTTLLRATLNAHPDIAAGPESTVFLRRISSPHTIAERFDLSSAAVERLLRTSRSQIDFIERFAELCLGRRQKSVWADKTPENVGRLDFIFRHFPRAKFIHVVRDGRDVICSLRTQPWMKLAADKRQSPAGLLDCADYWARRVDAGLSHRGDPRYAEVRYEDIVQKTETTLRHLLAFVGVPWTDAVLDRAYVNRHLAEEEGAPASRAGGPLFNSSIGRWRRELTADSIRLVAPALAPTLGKLGYIAMPGADDHDNCALETAVGYGD